LKKILVAICFATLSISVIANEDFKLEIAQEEELSFCEKEFYKCQSECDKLDDILISECETKCDEKFEECIAKEQ
jgi:hypothetical protein